MIRKIIIYLLLVTGIGLLFYSPIKSAILTIKTHNIKYEYRKTSSGTNSTNYAISPPSFSEIVKIKDNSSFMGLIKIPSIDLEQMISPEYSDQSLFSGSVNLFPNRNPIKDNIVLLGHHVYDEKLFFGKLKNLKLNSQIDIIFEDMVYRYEVVEKYVTNETNIAVMDTQKNTPKLTLITCDTPNYTNKRLIIEAQLVQENKSTLSVLTTEVYKEGKQQKIRDYLPILLLLLTYAIIFYVTFKVRRDGIE